ncbi:MAG TPA: protein kinase, partial [Polyangiaceae bacterium]|nr:protein kinase [Polyangiaceae bacterium]
MGEQFIKRKFSDRPGAEPSQTPASKQGITRFISRPLSARGRLTRALASPWGILIVFPGLVLILGVFLTWLARDALMGSNLELARTRMSDQARLVAEHLESALGQADVVLDELQSMAPGLTASSPPQDVALALKRLIMGRPGASYVSISFPDGTFEGAFVDEDGALRFQVSRILTGYTEERVYDYTARETLTLRELRKSNYDPRQRSFYKQAVLATHAVWTDPYPFARTGDTGITRTAAVRTEGPTPHAVLTIDFDVRRLSPLLKRQDEQTRSNERSERPILYHNDGTILADPHVRLRKGPAQGSVGLLNVRSAHDPVLSAFFEHGSERRRPGFSTFSTPHGPYLAATAQLSAKSGLDWSVAFIAPEESFLASLNTYLRRSYVLAGVALLLATFVSSSFARLIVRVRKEASDAREAARLARKEARELGSYRLVRRLGVGGMGEVWLAEHRLLARQAAIKLIKQSAQNDLAQERFRREAQSLAQLRSRNTIDLFDYGVTEDGTFFYVMELLDGVDLETLVVRYGPQHPARVVNILIQACRSLAEAH